MKADNQRNHIVKILDKLFTISDSGEFQFQFSLSPPDSGICNLELPHQHPFYELKFSKCVSGSGMNHYQIQVEPPGVIHDSNAHPCFMTLKLMRDSVFCVVTPLGFVCYYTPLAFSAARALFKMCEIEKEYYMCGWSNRLKAEFNQIMLSGLIRLFELLSSDIEEVTSPFHVARIFMENNFHNPEISGADIASASSRSLQALNVIFKKQTGKTVWKYFMELRLHKSMQSLCLTNMGIKEIAESSGWFSNQYFANVFHRKYGMSPSKFRQEFRKNKLPGIFCFESA